MSILAQHAAAARPRLDPRALARLAAIAFGLATLALALRLSPQPMSLPPLGLGAGALFAGLVLASLAQERELKGLARGLALAALGVGILAASGISGERLAPAFGLLSLGGLAFGAWRLIPVHGARLAPRAILALLALAALAGAYNAYYVLLSRDLMIADFMYYRLVSVAVASLLDSGRWPALLLQLAASMKSDYSWAPALGPGLALAIGGPLSRAIYQGAVDLLYVAPAVYALGWLARALALRAGLDASFARSGFALALALAGVVAAYPTGLAVAARGMPDIGGLALVVVALHLADRLARLLALRAGRDARLRPLARRLALALTLTLFAMFLFRRWYAFAGVGILAMLALETGVAAARRRADFRWRLALEMAATAMLAGLALASPVLVDWLPDPAAHDYARIYAAYRKPADVLLGLVGDWYGFGVLAAALAAGAALAFRSRDGRLLRLTAGSAALAAALFLRVQSPYVHHVFLIAPAVTAVLAAAILGIAQRSRIAAALAAAGLAALTLTPLGALAPRGVFPTYALPHPPRADLAELARLKLWVDARATPEHKVCGLGSSYTFSGQLISELWQLGAAVSPLHADPRLRTDVVMSDVDTVEGPPSPDMKDCAILIVGDPVQTHLIPSYQQNVILPSREMLSGEGIGAHYRRTGEVFHLEKGVSAVVFERVSPLSDADMAALAERWRAARAEAAKAP